ncbi:thiamine-triphosphatase-like [Paramacrobiotus metropolitanus]|uniref:thiamine-triphosphatase-like n=1 Tax=Paramacrobiotus metropolitanus TaxID=2943436 RepID=UPI00244632D6|nr:thiamine-triphosphatase-like [Paramacrobiotus metropolitanus]
MAVNEHSSETFVRDVEEEDDGNVSDDEDTVEVERKFLVPVDFHERLKQHGGRCLVEESFTDEYFDRDDYAFTMNDMWLRVRDGKWELRYGEPDNLDVPSKGTDQLRRTVYHEQHNPEEILKTLQSKGLLENSVESDDLAYVMNSEPFRSFATITAVHKTFGVPSVQDLLPAKISVEAAELGYRVGEIEVSVDNNESIPEALQTIRKLSELLGFEPLANMKEEHMQNGG